MKSDDIAQQLGYIRATQEAHDAILESVAEDIKQARNDIRCLERKWWRTAGAWMGVTAVLAVLSTGIGIKIGFDRISADYMKKDTIPVQAIIEYLNTKEAKASVKEGTDGNISTVR
jgi:hypothetical protein